MPTAFRDSGIAGPRLRSSAAPRPLHSGDARVAAHPPRTCAARGCAGQLSRYNPSSTCTLHDGWGDGTTRPARSS